MLLSIVVLVVIVVAAVAVFVEDSSHSKASTSLSTGTGTVTPFKILYDNLEVGYDGGLWQFGFQDAGNSSIAAAVVVLFTPIEGEMCTGLLGGLQFSNCSAYSDVPSSAGPSPNGFTGYPLNYTFSGYTTGAGAGSATPGQNYTVGVAAKFSDGSSVIQNYTIEAVSG